MIGPYGLSRFVNSTAFNLIRIQTGRLSHYIFFIVLGLIGGWLVSLPFGDLSINFFLLILCFLCLTIFVT